jgi:D-alanyl-D-alanine carboxypeptidase
MNDYAKEIGLTKSHFVNSTGLPAEGHVMTARELAMLARFLIYTYPEYYHFFGQRDFTFNKHTFNNRNPLIFAPDLGVDGLKTGYIEEAGYGLVASAKRGEQRLILVVNGLNTKQEREGEPRRLIEWGFKSFRPFRLFDEGPEGERRVGLGRHPALRVAGRRRQYQHHPACHRERQGVGIDRLSGADQGSDPQGRSGCSAPHHVERIVGHERDSALCS